MKRAAAEIIREYGPFPGVDRVNGVTYDGRQVWFADGDKLNALDPASGKTLRSIDAASHAGTAFDGQHLFQIAEGRIRFPIHSATVSSENGEMVRLLRSETLHLSNAAVECAPMSCLPPDRNTLAFGPMWAI